jgi:hypothetical protein
MIGNSGQAYADRVKTIKNDGEYLFEKFCNIANTQFQRLGFDEDQDNVPNFWRINPVLRNLPDYVINTKNKTFVVAVKGTDNFKQKEFELLPSMVEAFSSKEAPLIYAFCFKEKQKPIWVNPNKIMELYEKSVDQQWHDKVIYRNLNLRMQHERLQYALLDSQKPVRPVLQSNDFSGQGLGSTDF